MAGGGAGGTNPNSGSGRSNVDSLSTLSKRNATYGLNSSFFQSGTTRGKSSITSVNLTNHFLHTEQQNDSKNSFNQKIFNQNNNGSSSFGQPHFTASTPAPPQKVPVMTFDGSQTSH